MHGTEWTHLGNIMLSERSTSTPPHHTSHTPFDPIYVQEAMSQVGKPAETEGTSGSWAAKSWGEGRDCQKVKGFSMGQWKYSS